MTEAIRLVEKMSVDVGQLRGTHYLVGVDRYSGYPMIKQLISLDTGAVTTTLEDWFLEHGKPVSIRSDGGPQFRGGVSDWRRQRHETFTGKKRKPMSTSEGHC